MILTCVILLVKNLQTAYERNKITTQIEYKYTYGIRTFMRIRCIQYSCWGVFNADDVEFRIRYETVTKIVRTPCTCDGNLLHNRRFLSSHFFLYLFDSNIWAHVKTLFGIFRGVFQYRNSHQPIVKYPLFSEIFLFSCLTKVRTCRNKWNAFSATGDIQYMNHKRRKVVSLENFTTKYRGSSTVLVINMQFIFLDTSFKSM